MLADKFMSTLIPPVRQKLEQALTIRTYRSGNLVVSQHDQTDDVYFVLKGSALATLYSNNGKMVSYRNIGKGAIFGELSAIDRAPRSTDVVAQGHLEVGRMTGREFRVFIEASPELMWALLEYLSLRTRHMTERIFEFSTLLVKQRMIRELIRMTRTDKTVENTALITPMPTHFDLAARISTHREAVSRELSNLTKLHLIRKTPQGLLITDLEALKALTEFE